MVRKPSEEKRRELAALKDWCLAFLNFIRDIDQTNSANHLHSVAEEGIEAAFRRGDLRGLKIVMRDFQEWASGFPQPVQKELDAVLCARFGSDYGLATLERARLREIARIIRRETIADEDEHRLLLARVDEIADDSSKKTELEKINRLLAAVYSA